MTKQAQNPETQKMIDEFSQIPIKEKKDRLVKMIDALDKKYLTQLDRVKNALLTNSKAGPKFCLKIYRDLLLLWDNISDLEKEAAVRRINTTQEQLKRMHEREAREKAEENPDALLDLID